ncbi:MAG: hypothetical protein H7061_03965 [Bdellovibrionaceae bacterium]|nr:hypothetical protein [Bdellovibrio sp.]
MTLTLLLTLKAQAQVATFDTCVYSLYSLGGISKTYAQKRCVEGISQQALDCQRKEFYYPTKYNDDQTSLSAREKLDYCIASKKEVDISQTNFFKGFYQEPHVQPTKKNVCSITVNSTEERDAFRSELNPNEYTWVELLPSNADTGKFIPRDDFWIKRACEKQIRCDILVISGHFAATFLGTSGFEIRLEDLTKYSCEEGCKNFFDSVKKVYLFGCNTLASRDKDSREVYQYRDLLFSDGVAPQTSQRIAARRYTNYGIQIREEISQVFPKAEKIYGFDGPSPLGINIRRDLIAYLKDINSERNFLSTIGKSSGNMISIAGSPRDELMCSATPNYTRHQEMSTYAGIKTYIFKHGRTLPVPAFDIVAEALQKSFITAGDANEFNQLIFNQFRPSDVDRIKLLCPLTITAHAPLVPKDLDCVKNLTWLRYRADEEEEEAKKKAALAVQAATKKADAAAARPPRRR